MKADHENLQGSWTIISLEIDGAPMPPGDAGIVLKRKRFKTTSMGAEYEGTFALGEKTSPKTIDMNFTKGPEKGNTSLGIYKLDGEQWTICLSLSGTTRPKSFKTKPGSGFALETLTRSAPAGKKSKRASATAEAPPIVTDPEIAELGGEWSMQSLVMSGSPLPATFVKSGKRVTNANQIVVTVSGQVVLKATCSVNASISPKQIDYTLASGAKQFGIYDLHGDTLRTCFVAPGKDRPDNFESSNGDGRTFTVWKRK